MLTILAILHYILLRFGCVENVGKCPLLLDLLLKVQNVPIQFLKRRKSVNSFNKEEEVNS